MKKNFGFDTEFNKIKVIARSLWMGCERGEGELEIDDQGRFDQSRFSQETEAIGQQAPRIGEHRPKLRLTTEEKSSERVSSAGRTLNSSSTPQFSFSVKSDSQTAEQRAFQFLLEDAPGEVFNKKGHNLSFEITNRDLEPSAKPALKLSSQQEKAAMFLAEKTQSRLAALFRESEEG